MTDKAKKFVEALRTKCAEQGDCNSCAKSDYCYYGGDYAMRSEAADLIESLAAELEQVKRERDAAVNDITESAPCFACKNFRRNGGECKGAKSCLWAMIECEEFDEEYTGMSWEWRGVKEG